MEHLWTGGFLPDYDAGLFLWCPGSKGRTLFLQASLCPDHPGRATLTAAPGYARRWCTIKTHHLQRKHLATPPQGTAAPGFARLRFALWQPISDPFSFIFPKSVMRNYLIINKNENLWSLREAPQIFIKHSVATVCSSRSCRGWECMVGCMYV